jgi:hypothetical protein
LDKQQNLVGLLPYLPSSTINHFLLANSLLYRLGIGIQTFLTNHEDKILEEARIELKKFSQSVTKQKTDLLIVVLPLLYPEDVWSTPEKQRYAAILQMLKQADLKHIDLLPAFHQALNEQLPLHHQTANPFQPSKPLAQRFAASIYDYDHLPSARETALIRLPRRTQ